LQQKEMKLLLHFHRMAPMNKKVCLFRQKLKWSGFHHLCRCRKYPCVKKLKQKWQKEQ
jgi:hypothetical protein